MLPRSHVIASSIAGIIVWSYFKSFTYAAVTFMSGVLIDLDHVFDYYINHSVTFRIRDVYKAICDFDFKKLYLVFHSYELIILLWVLIYTMRLGNFWKAIAIGMTQHIAMDQIGNPINTFGYFIIYRFAKGFETKSILHARR